MSRIRLVGIHCTIACHSVVTGGLTSATAEIHGLKNTVVGIVSVIENTVSASVDAKVSTYLKL
jgi:hypothetical protein